VLLAILTGVISGIAKAGLIAVVNVVLHTADPLRARPDMGVRRPLFSPCR
jgi:hypothetical protein